MTEQNTTGTASAPEPVAPVALQAPGTPQAPVAAPAAESPAPEGPEVPAAPKDRRKLRGFLRWTAAVLVFAGAGAGTAYGVLQSERTELPGLSTEDDGRWVYHRLAKPELPPGAALPRGADNVDETHYAPLPALVLQAPAGARPDTGLKADKDGAVSPDAFLEEYPAASRAELKQSFEYEGLRQITGRGWTMPDGTRTRIYLLRFHSSEFVDTFRGCNTNVRLNGADAFEIDAAWSKAKITQTNNLGSDGFNNAAGTLSSSDVSVYAEAKPYGDEQTKLGCLQAGDVQAVIIQTRKGEVATVPFHQTVLLQSQLLS
ncbi:hypothetical protein AMK16_31585 [Streptomyces sp. CB00455]|uniref:hypothetical protein n=1 Tax=Streptomyces sp. CB00455 TaxID=1703927 RepID=UPI00093C248F|nr:hypothetical protein [Streptomyces sp. CB00455]OKK13077.1 hypothetical protein AMK16_31585 [Streptomyces sp. CB00455]